MRPKGIYRVLSALLALSGIAAAAGSQTGCFLAVVGGAGAEAGYVGTQKDRTARETMSDQWLHTKVKSALLSEKGVSSGDINVDVFKGRVTLKGAVSSDAQKQAALAAAAKVQGVRGVVDKLFVVK